jgi:hypothetical protein
MRLLIALMASLLLLASSNAQRPYYSPQDLTGTWFIQIFGYPAGESYSTSQDKVADGFITFYKVSEGDYDCDFNIAFNFDTSKTYGTAGAAWAVESCRAMVTGDSISIQSSVLRASDPGYRPDNFQLRIDAGERMTGSMVGETDGRGGPFLVIVRRR